MRPVIWYTNTKRTRHVCVIKTIYSWKKKKTRFFWLKKKFHSISHILCDSWQDLSFANANGRLSYERARTSKWSDQVNKWQYRVSSREVALELQKLTPKMMSKTNRHELAAAGAHLPYDGIRWRFVFGMYRQLILNWQYQVSRHWNTSCIVDNDDIIVTIQNAMKINYHGLTFEHCSRI